MKAYCTSCETEQQVPFRSRELDDYRCSVCRRPLRALPSSKRPVAVPQPASLRQRQKIIAEPRCIACGVRAGEYIAVDPAHLAPRSRGGCDDPLCVVGLCRTPSGQGCHRLFDDGKLDLLAIIADRWPAERAEVQHMLEHLLPVEVLQRLANDRIQWRGAA